MNNDNLGDRCKAYEATFKNFLPPRMPVILRLDGTHFHSYLKGCQKPFDAKVISCMDDTLLYLCKNVQNVVLGYVQSDEISLLLNNFKDYGTEAWYNNNVQKMCSVAAGMASAYFSSISDRIFGKIKLATFDCRAFAVPKEDVCNVLYWRQKDCERNSVSMLARSLYSHKECHDKNSSQLKEMCLKKGQSWEALPTSQKHGRCAVKIKSWKTGTNPKTGEVFEALRSEWVIDNNIPSFIEDREYINKHLSFETAETKAMGKVYYVNYGHPDITPV